MSLPLMSDLPNSSSAAGWSWERVTASTPAEGFWLGTDPNGDTWLTKLRGSFYAYREITFSKLAQKMGWSCQSSMFLTIDEASSVTLGVDLGTIHAVHWYMPEHGHKQCGKECPINFLVGREINIVDDLVGSKISNLLDWPKGDYAAHLFGANDGPDRLFTTDHEFVIIDSEQMFSTGPTGFDNVRWWNNKDGKPSDGGRTLAKEVCEDYASLTKQNIQDALAIPHGIIVNETWPIEPILHKSMEYAKSFLHGESLSRYYE